MFGWKRSYLERQNANLVEQLVEALKVSQALNVKLADGLDRVLVSKFDPPLMPKPQEQRASGPMFPGDIGDVLSVEDDGEFVNRMETLTQ